MDKSLESILQSPLMKMASETQARLNSLSYAAGSKVDFLKLAQNSDHSQRWVGHLVTQDLFSQMTKAFPQNNLAIDDSIAKIVKNLADSNSRNARLFESVELNKAIIDAFEATLLGSKPQTQFILPKGFTSKSQIGDLGSIISEATEAFKQYDKFSALESFKAISRLENFPNDIVRTKDYYKAHEITENSLSEVKSIDAMISDEVSSVDDFNSLSEETQNSLKKVFSEYYEYFIIETVVSLCLIQEGLDKDLDLSNKSFVFVDNIESSIFFISNYWNQNKIAIINGLIATAVYNMLSWFLFTK